MINQTLDQVNANLMKILNGTDTVNVYHKCKAAAIIVRAEAIKIQKKNKKLDYKSKKSNIKLQYARITERTTRK